MAFDPARGRVVLFGGSGGNFQLFADTWTWDGRDWRQEQPDSSPPARREAAVAYDPNEGRVLLFGGAGAGNSLMGDTWTWDGAQWSQLHPVPSPPARVGGALAYHAPSKTLVLSGFGNWTWDGARWRQLEGNGPVDWQWMPTAPMHATGSVVLFNGNTWTWDGKSWMQQRPPAGNPAVATSGQVAPSMAYDAARRQVVLFGGGPLDAPSRATWIWDGTNWTQR